MSSGVWALMGSRWRGDRVGGDGAPPSSWVSRGAAVPMVRGVGGTTSVSSGFLGNVIGPRWRAERDGGDGAPPSSWVFEGALPRRWRGALEGRPPCRQGFLAL